MNLRDKLRAVDGGGAKRPAPAERAEADVEADVPAPGPAPVEKAELSEREKEIVDLLSKGYTTPQIAEALSLSPETIKWYRKKLLAKFDVANVAELVLKARDTGVLY